MDNISLLKENLRQELAKKRGSIPAAAKTKAALALCDLELPFLAKHNEAVISFYMPKGSELDPRSLAKKLAAEGHALCLPVCKPGKKKLSFKSYQFGDVLSLGAFDISEPLENQAEVLPQIILLPLLAIDRQGNRLGYGGGYYDQTLADLKKNSEIMAIGLAFEAQIVEAVPREAHDMVLDGLITEDRVIEF